MPKTFQTSQYIKIIYGKNGAILYHSLFSKPLFISRGVIKILNYFRHPKNIYRIKKNKKFSQEASFFQYCEYYKKIIF